MVSGTSAVAELAGSRLGEPRRPGPARGPCRKAAAGWPRLCRTRCSCRPAPGARPPRSRGARSSCSARWRSPRPRCGPRRPRIAPMPRPAGWPGSSSTAQHSSRTSATGSYPDAGLTVDAVLAFAAAGSAGDYARHGDGLDGHRGRDADGLRRRRDRRVRRGGLAKVALPPRCRDWTRRPSAGWTCSPGCVAAHPVGRYADRSQTSATSATPSASRTRSSPPTGPAAERRDRDDLPGRVRVRDRRWLPADLEKPACAPDTDATAMVVQALIAAGDSAAAAAARSGWRSSRSRDGAFAGTGPTGVPNATAPAWPRRRCARPARRRPPSGRWRYLLRRCSPAARRRWRSAARSHTTTAASTRATRHGRPRRPCSAWPVSASATCPAPARSPTRPSWRAPRPAPDDDPAGRPPRRHRPRPVRARRHPRRPPPRRPRPLRLPLQPRRRRAPARRSCRSGRSSRPARVRRRAAGTGADLVPVAWLGVALIVVGVVLALRGPTPPTGLAVIGPGRGPALGGGSARAGRRRRGRVAAAA